MVKKLKGKKSTLKQKIIGRTTLGKAVRGAALLSVAGGGIIGGMALRNRGGGSNTTKPSSVVQYKPSSVNNVHSSVQYKPSSVNNVHSSVVLQKEKRTKAGNKAKVDKRLSLIKDIKATDSLKTHYQQIKENKLNADRNFKNKTTASLKMRQVDRSRQGKELAKRISELRKQGKYFMRYPQLVQFGTGGSLVSMRPPKVPGLKDKLKGFAFKAGKAIGSGINRLKNTQIGQTAINAAKRIRTGISNMLPKKPKMLGGFGFSRSTYPELAEFAFGRNNSQPGSDLAKKIH